ncbi:DUF2786 domain-containing protein [Rhodobacter capsulatus]|uniref:DUF2786 domain-containing protein n=1 Tax=Rhodobacter capsulatus TaxID=1061 RepID=UPI004025FEDC
MSEDIKRKISALLEMTRARGCSEAEAIAATEKAAQLMKDHGLSEADVLFTKLSSPSKTSGAGVRDRLWSALAIATNTALIFGERTVTFVGTGPGPDIAVYLFTVLDRAIDGAIMDYKATPNYRRRKSLKSKREAVADFTAAMVLRLHMKLHDLFADIRSDEARAAARGALAQMFPNRAAVRGRASVKGRNTVAIAAGAAAGNDVSLSHGVAAGGADRPRLGQ